MKEMKEEFADLRKYLPILARHPNLLAGLEHFCGISQIRQLFTESAQDQNPFLGVTQRVGMSLDFQGEEIPAEGPVVIVANHAHGGPDAIALSAKALEVRRDVKILANAELMNLDGVQDYFLPVSLLQKGNAAQENTTSLRRMLKHVRTGGCLVVFPAGKVATWREGAMKDPLWNDHVVTLIQRMKATIVPVWFYGSNPAWIRLLSQGSLYARRALIPRGFLEKAGCGIVAKVGSSFPSSELADKKGDGSRWLRMHLERLGDSGN